MYEETIHTQDDLKVSHVPQPASQYPLGHHYRADLNEGEGSVEWLEFQRGPVPENGHNGWTNEAVIAVLIHRIEHLNSLFPCRENSLAITKLQEAKLWLEERTRGRVNRGVEGKEVA